MIMVIWNFWLGSYERKKQRLFSEIVTECSVVCDIGAHLDFYKFLIAELTGPKGKVIAFKPSSRNSSSFGSRYRYWDFTHEVAFTRSSLNQILRNAGFSEVIFRSTGPVPKGLKSSIRFLLWKLIHYLLKCYMLIETGSGEGIFTQNIISIAKK